MSKYLNKRTPGPNGRIYHSMKEADRAWALFAMQRQGLISELREQVVYVLMKPAKELGYARDLRYVADFIYYDRTTKSDVIEDVKPYNVKTRRFRLTAEYKIKKRLMKQLLGLHVTEV